jgi:hypothetical protein
MSLVTHFRRLSMFNNVFRLHKARKIKEQNYVKRYLLRGNNFYYIFNILYFCNLRESIFVLNTSTYPYCVAQRRVLPKYWGEKQASALTT